MPSPVHNTFVLVIFELNKVGSVIIIVCVLLQLFASEIVQVYVPAVNAFAVADVPPKGNQP